MEPETGEMEALGERLRSALAARSALVTAQSLRPAAPPRPRPWFRRGRWWPHVTLVAGAVAAAVAIAVVTLPVGSRPADGRTTGTGPASSRPSPLPGKRIDLDRLSLTVPPGWVARDFKPGTAVCITRTNVPAPGDADACATYGVMVGTGLQDAADVPRLLNRDDGWTMGDTASCWNADGSYDPMSSHYIADVTSSRLTARGTVPVAGQRATYRAWHVTCATGPAFTARLWWVPKDDTEVRALRLPDRDVPVADRIISSIVLR